MNMAAGDATVLGRLFQHLHRKDQIDSFLSAVQEIRQKRVTDVTKTARENRFTMALPAGVEQDDVQHKAERIAAGEKQVETLMEGVRLSLCGWI